MVEIIVSLIIAGICRFLFLAWRRGRVLRKSEKLMLEFLDLSRTEAVDICEVELNSKIFDIMMIISTLLFILFAIIVLGQSYHWLRYGDWPKIDIANVIIFLKIQEPQLAWVGAQKIIDWMLGVSVSFYLFASALFVGWWATRHDSPVTSEPYQTGMMKVAKARQSSRENS